MILVSRKMLNVILHAKLQPKTSVMKCFVFAGIVLQWTEAQDNWTREEYRRFSYPAPPIQHQNKWFRVCSQRHTDTCQHLRDLQGWLSGPRSLSGSCPVKQRNSNENNFKIVCIQLKQQRQRFRHYIIHTTLSYTFDRAPLMRFDPRIFELTLLEFYLGCQ